MGRFSTFLAAVGRAFRGLLASLWCALSSDPDDRPWERAAVRIVVPFAFVVSGLIATLVAYRADRPPAISFGSHLIFAAELLLFGFYGLLLVLVPLVRAIGDGELPIELTTRGARFAERAVEDSMTTNQEITERLGSLDDAMADREAEIEGRARQAIDGMHDFEAELASMRGRLDELEQQVRGGYRDARKTVGGQ